MSRVAKNPISIPKGMEVLLEDQFLTLKTAKGSLRQFVREEVVVSIDGGVLSFTPKEQFSNADALAGTLRALINNLVQGLVKGFERKLILVGVGYRAQLQGRTLNLTLGFSHPVTFAIPEGITIETPSQTEIVIKGIDRQQVGQVAANIRQFRPPEPYKGKGVKYSDEVIILKETKKKK